MTRTSRRAPRRLLAGIGAAAVLLAAGACSSDGSGGSGGSGGGASGRPTGTVTVFAAASLQESFTTLGKTFEKRYPGTKVAFNFGGSDSLAAGITGARPPTCSPRPARGR